MPYGIPGSCAICDLGPPLLIEIEAKFLLGESLRALGELAGCSNVTVKNHVDNGHFMPEVSDVYATQAWMKRNVSSPLQTLEKAAQKSRERPIDDTPEAAKSRALDRLWVLEEYGIRILQRMEQDGDFRGSFQGVDVLRKLVMDFARIEQVLRPQEEKKTIQESPDVVEIRESILALIHEKRAQ